VPPARRPPVRTTSRRRFREPAVSRDLLADVRAACRAVAAESRHVRIDEAALAAFAHRLVLPDAPALPDPRHHWLLRGDGSAVFMLLLDAVNFGSGWSAHLVKPPGLSTYFTTAAALRTHFERHGVPSAGELAALQPAGTAAIFGQDGVSADHPVRELVALWTAALNELARHVLAVHDGDWLGPVAAARGRVGALVAELGALAAYADVARWRGREVPLFKRAQITAADLIGAGRAAVAAGGELPWWARWEDAHRLTLFADNLVPHVLRLEGVLVCTPQLAATIEAGVELVAGCEEEVELRAVALHAVERLVEVLAAAGRPTSALDLDQALWNAGQSPAIKARPRHRCRTRFY